jgi:N-acetyl-anhydromuramyl-L-alanine amidase AmpD
MRMMINTLERCAFAEPHPGAWRELSEIHYIVLHRSDVGHSAYAVARWHHMHKAYTGGAMPYHYFISAQGNVEQGVSVSYIAPAAKILNRSGIQIACDGDFRAAVPKPEQGLALVDLCVYLFKHIPSLQSIVGHTDKEGTTNYPGHVCPGKHLSAERIEQVVLERARCQETNKI